MKYKALLTSEHFKSYEVFNWCRHNIGEELIEWKYVAYRSERYIRFRFKKNYTLFLLRWS